jgi:PKD repeat protein
MRPAVSSRKALLCLFPVAFLIAAGLAPALASDAPAGPAGPSLPLNDIKSGAPAEGRAVERPDHDGPYVNGTIIERFRASTKLYSINLKIFYPAVSAGTDTPPDASGAPYPAVLMMPYAGGDETAYDFAAPRLVSWGFVIVCVGQNQADQNSGNTTDLEDILDQLGRDNATAGHRLQGMVNLGACGITGHSRGGAYSIFHGWPVARLRVIEALAPALSDSSVDAVASLPAKPFQVQVGRLDTSFWAVSLHAYKDFRAPKHALDLAGTGHGGPFLWDLSISFFLRHLLGLTGYDRFLSGGPAVDDAADEKYFLNFTLENGSFFPPDITVAADALSPDEDSQVGFTLAWEGFLPLGHPRSNFTWDFTSDGAVDLRGPYLTASNASFTRAGPTSVTARFVLGGLSLDTKNTLRLEVRNPPPAVVAGGDLSAAEDEALELSAFGSDTPSDQPVLSYSWDFGDGTVAKAASATHAWKQAGNYTARVTVRDDEGAASEAAVAVTVRNLPPTASAAADIAADMDAEVQFLGAGSDTPSDRTALRYRWDFGDGLSSGWSIEPAASHAYTAAGRFTAVLIVEDEDGASDRAALNVTVRNLPPSCNATAPRPGATVQKDEPAELDGAGADTPSDRPHLQYSWDFGDGSSSAWGPSPKAEHTYKRGGNFTAVLSVRDRAGEAARSSVRFYVFNQPPAVKALSPAGGAFEEDSPVQFSAEGWDTASDSASLEYVWLVDGKDLPGRTVEASFTTEGPHAFAVTVTDREGASATASGTVFIANPAPRLSASVVPGSLQLYGSVRFSASAEDTASDAGALSFSWDFGDGGLSSEASGTHVYRRAGTFTVRASVRDDEGARDTETFSVRVDEPAVTPPPGGGDGPAPAPSLSSAAAAAVAGALVLASASAAALLWRRRRRG